MPVLQFELLKKSAVTEIQTDLEAAVEADRLLAEQAATDAQTAQGLAETAQGLAEGAASQTALDAIATAADRVQTGLDAIATAADRVQTGLDAVATGADALAISGDRVQTGLDAVATAADRVQTGSDVIATAADRVQTGLDVVATAADRVQTGLDAIATAADRVQTGLDRTATGQDKIATAADRVQTGLDRVQTGADRVQTVSDRAAVEALFGETPVNVDSSAVLYEVGVNAGLGTAAPTARLSVVEKAAINEFGGFMIKLTNKTGANSVKGTVVYASTTTDNAFEVNPIDGDMPFGVVFTADIADGAECWVVVSGVAEVLLVNTVATTRSYIAYSSASVAGRIDTAAAIPVAATHFREIGHTLESKTAGTNILVKCVLHFN